MLHVSLMITTAKTCIRYTKDKEIKAYHYRKLSNHKDNKRKKGTKDLHVPPDKLENV